MLGNAGLEACYNYTHAISLVVDYPEGGKLSSVKGSRNRLVNNQGYSHTARKGSRTFRRDRFAAVPFRRRTVSPRTLSLPDYSPRLFQCRTIRRDRFAAGLLAVGLFDAKRTSPRNIITNNVLKLLKINKQQY